ncbi:S-adenosyl-L-methionine-dependent methyltransferases superfamily protein isoform 1 [Theobroma cacao]|uniref:Methyltransferase n=1 Tax=Theobroma cacao TaxID=3641 RepID=A0A061FK69_THECC|nr:S-adenosyl-L-methionine-dependent methyltransferases superfamily protein isoform 1 [Theobroma cacao]EOY17695.1 S-adenosyl-L-methionine-dependent methyltransferases superfamily protein isoform 1 [Theobroma cacao]EOY17696.1 S-adenosyl-L-methionine-dependent methyltransferases superfamily protein isoform 1 [Theobroma cacao]
MPISVPNLFKERKYPFLFALSILLISFAILFLTNSFSPFPSLPLSSELHVSQSQPPTPPPPPSSLRSRSPNDTVRFPPESRSRNDAASEVDLSVSLDVQWGNCKLGAAAVDYIPCLDNWKAIKELKSRKHMEHRERHCPSPSPRCLVPLPSGYKAPVQWPKSRDMIWYDNVPHPKLVEYKKEQNWVRKSGDYFVFPGGGTQFKNGVTSYIDFIKKTLPAIQWGKHIRVILDVGCGVASFGGFLLDKGVITMSFAPKDEHEAQIQFALERGIPAILSVIGTQKLTFPDNAYDLIHCARCRVHWDGDGGKPLLELNRILRPGGYFIWSATPVYRDDERDRNVWKSMVALTTSMCWKVVAKTVDSTGIGLVIYQKPASYSCYEQRKEKSPPLCDQKNNQNISWYEPLSYCLSRLPADNMGNLLSWPKPWPRRLSSKPPSLPSEPDAKDIFNEDSKHWAALVSDVYLDGLAINWASIRNVMDMNAGYGGFAAALIEQSLWVMNVVPIDAQDTLPIIFDRGLIGVYHDWCESFNTYPRTYDILHSSFLFGNLKERCDIIDVAVEMDRILRPGGYLLVQDTMEMIKKLNPVLRSLHWSTSLYQGQFLVGKKGSWRPSDD